MPTTRLPLPRPRSRRLIGVGLVAWIWLTIRIRFWRDFRARDHHGCAWAHHCRRSAACSERGLHLSLLLRWAGASAVSISALLRPRRVRVGFFSFSAGWLSSGAGAVPDCSGLSSTGTSLPSKRCTAVEVLSVQRRADHDRFAGSRPARPGAAQSGGRNPPAWPGTSKLNTWLDVGEHRGHAQRQSEQPPDMRRVCHRGIPSSVRCALGLIQIAVDRGGVIDQSFFSGLGNECRRRSCGCRRSSRWCRRRPRRRSGRCSSLRFPLAAQARPDFRREA